MRILVPLLSIILLPTSVFSAPAPLADYEIAENLSHQGTCDAGQTEVRVYQNQTYFLRVITLKNNNIYYRFSKDLDDPYHFFVKNLGSSVMELDQEKWLENLTAESPNVVKRELGQKNDCSVKKIK